MIIAQFCDTYPPQLDGVGRVAASYCQNLTAMGHKTYYVGPSSPRAEEPDFDTVLSQSIPIPKELHRIGLPFLDYKYRKQLNAIPFDLVHVHSPFIAGYEGKRLARRLDVPLVSTFHSKYYDDFKMVTKSDAIAWMLVKKIVRFYEQCDAVWSVNNATADVLREYGYKGEILVVENGTNREPLNPDGVERLKNRVTIREDVPTLLFVGQHNYKKNLHGILGACKILKEKGVDFQLVTAGDGPDFNAILREADSLGIREKCHFLGFISDRSELMALYHASDLLVFPSIYDNAPMVLREAAAMGTPGLLVRNSCAAEGIRDGDNGFITPSESAEDIAVTILRAVPDMAAVGKRASETVPVAWKDIMRQVIGEYEKLIEIHKARKA